MQYDPETMKVHVCKKCKGLGFGFDLKGRRFKCAECSGTGRVIQKTLKEEFQLDDLCDTASFDKETMKVVICKECGGLGSIIYAGEEHGCTECNGNGRIIEQKIITEFQLHHVEGLTEKEEG